LKLDTKRDIGNAGLSVAIAYFGSNGYTVSVPLNDTQPYDLIVDKDDVLSRVQVKATNNVIYNDVYALSLRTISGTTRKAMRTVKDTNVDLLFCLCGDGTMYLIPTDEIKNKSVLDLGKRKSKFAGKNVPDYSKYIVQL